LLVPKHRGASVVDRATTGLPPDLLNRAAARLQILLWLYAFTFFMSALFVPLLIPAERRVLFGHAANWAPGVISIAVAVSVALAMRVAQLRPAVVTVLALVFEVVSSYGIAAAEFLQPQGLNAGPSWVGLSWVAVWVLLFNVVVPTVPRYAVIAALASVASVPAMVLTSISVFPPPVSRPNGWMVFIAFGFPYLLVVIMAYVGARVVYSLGTEVSRARELGSYRLEERLGEGGMGEVWRARHRLLARPAAIKLIRSSIPGHAAGISDDMRRRFEREAQVIAQLRSPHTVTLFDFGVTDEGSFYYVMELLDGVDTDTLIKRFGPIPAERVVHILRQMCHSLSEAESCGLVHRHQARKHLSVPLWRGPRLREDSRLRDRKSRARDGVGGADGPHDTQRDSRHARIHRTGASIGRRGCGYPRRHLLDWLRGLLAPDRSTRVHGRHADEAADGACAHAAGATLLENRDSDSTGPGRSGVVLPRQGPGTSAEVGPRSPRETRRGRAPATMD